MPQITVNLKGSAFPTNIYNSYKQINIALQYIFRKVQEHQEGLKLNMTHQILACLC
jgi:hypothetical protein